jgi:hypothetical protein
MFHNKKEIQEQENNSLLNQRPISWFWQVITACVVAHSFWPPVRLVNEQRDSNTFMHFTVLKKLILK